MLEQVILYGLTAEQVFEYLIVTNTLTCQGFLVRVVNKQMCGIRFNAHIRQIVCVQVEKSLNISNGTINVIYIFFKGGISKNIKFK